MSDETETVWRAFFAESDEHLEAVDGLLSRGDHDLADRGFSRDDVAALFRGFHSLKGLSQAMDLTNMQAVAHRAEDLLGVVREGRAPLDGPTAAMLLEVVDRLRQMREWVEAHRADPDAEPELVVRLEQMVRESAAAGGAAPTAAHVPAAPALSDDEDMLALYCELLGEQVPNLAEALATGDGGAAAEGVDELVHGAEVIGLDRLAADLRGVAGLARGLPDRAARSALVLALANLRAQLGLIEELAGVPAGADALASALEAHARDEAAARLAALHASLDRIDPQRPATLDAVVAAAADARTALDVGGLPQAAATVLLVEEQASRAAQGEIVWTPALAALARDMVHAVDALEGDIEAGRAAALQLDWQTRVRGGGPAAATGGRIAAALPHELRQSLTGGQLAQLERRGGEGWHVFDLLLDTESEPEIANDLAAWLSANTDVITTRTVTAGGMNWFEFLFAAPHFVEHVRSAMAALDPDQRCVRGLKEVVAPGSVAADAPARSSAAVIRVRVDAIETLMDGLDEMRVTLGSLEDALAKVQLEIAAVRGAGAGQFGGRGRAIQERLDLAEELRARVDAMHRYVRASCIELRVVPVDTVFARFPRLVRELAARLQREVDFEISGRDARLDKSMADLLVDPMMHLVRNALDHGIEPPAERVAAGKPRRAKLLVAATEHADGVHISVRDDGRGLDRAAIVARAVERGLVAADADLTERETYDLLFRSGFSTAAEVTEISGRGVGLDVVAYTLARIGGTVDIETRPGLGTCFTLRVPASASLQDVLLVEAGELVAIPQRRVVGAMVIEEVEEVGGERIVWRRGAPVRLHDLASLLGFPPLAAPAEAAVIVADGERLVALAVARVPQRREVFLKELHPMLAGLPAVAGATLMSDGTAVIVLDVDGVLDLARAAAAA